MRKRGIMQTHLVFTVIAKDRPGLVERMAEIIAGTGGNWIESSMARQTGAELPEGASAHLDLVSQDHPGILRDITRVLSEKGVSIEHLETEVVSGSMQGEALFKASADLRLPSGLDPASLSDALQETAGDLMADINLID